MKNVILAIALVNLTWESALLYYVFSGKVEIARPDYISQLSRTN